MMYDIIEGLVDMTSLSPSSTTDVTEYIENIFFNNKSENNK